MFQLNATAVFVLSVLNASPAPQSAAPAVVAPAGTEQQPETAAADNPALCWGDFDGDELLDVYAVVPFAQDRLLRNLGDGRFEDLTAGAGLSGNAGSRGAAWVDFDRDGLVDLYVVADRRERRLFHNRGGTFEDVTLAVGLSGTEGELDATWLDYDADGNPDVQIRTAGGDLLFHNTGKTWFERVELVELARTEPAQPTMRGVLVPAPSDGTRPTPPAGNAPSASGGSSDLSVTAAPFTGASTGPHGNLPASLACAGGVSDQALPTSCVLASTTPTLGMLYPLSNNLCVSVAGNVGIGTSSPGMKLDVSGNVRTSGQVISSVATGTAPLAVSSTTKVSNLNADTIDGLDSLAFSQLGTSIETAELANFAVTTPKLANDAVDSTKIIDGSVMAADMGVAAVTSNAIAASAVTSVKLATDAVTTTSIANAAVTSTKLAVDAVTTTSIANAAVTFGKLAGNSVDGSKIVDGTIGGADFTPASVNNSTIANGAVTATKLATDAVDSSKIFDGTITSNDLATGAVASIDILDATIAASDLATGAVTTANIAVGAVIASKIASDAVDGSKIIDGTIATNDLGTGAVTGIDILDETIASADIQDGTIASADIGNGAIQMIDIGQNGAGSGQVLKWGGSSWAPAADSTGIDSQWLNNGSSIYYSGGNVGVGVTAPGHPLHVVSAGQSPAMIEGSDLGGTWTGLRNTAAGGDTWHLISTGPSNGEGAGKLVIRDNDTSTVAMTLQPDGLVGVGTVAPESRMHVMNGSAGTVTANTNTTLTLESSTHNYLSLLAPDASQRGIIFGSPGGSSGQIVYNSGGVPNGMSVVTNGGTRMVVTASGNVGIGTFTPSTKLDVTGDIAVDSGNANVGTASNGLRFGGAGSGEVIGSQRDFATGSFGLDFYTSALPRMKIANDGNVGIGVATPTERLDVAGATRTQCVKITGGCDLAEPFEFVDGRVEPGMLMSIDPEHEGKLRMATRAYDTTVAGVISGAGGVKPGMTMSQEDVLDQGELVALAGRVYCWCDASAGAIRPGDLLTSSDTPGHAMRVADRALASGAIVGKALTSLSEGRGLVLMVVTLQ